MAIPARLDLLARRNIPFAREWTFTDEGEPQDFTGATVTLQVRQYGAQPGLALIDLVEVGADRTEGLRVSDGLISAWIDRTTLRFLPSGRPGADVVFAYDLIVALPGSVPEVWAYGTLTVTPGVTDRLILLTNETGAYLVTEDGAYLTGA